MSCSCGPGNASSERRSRIVVDQALTPRFGALIRSLVSFPGRPEQHMTHRHSSTMTKCHELNTVRDLNKWAFASLNVRRVRSLVQRDEAGPRRRETARLEVEGSQVLVEVDMQVLASCCLRALPCPGDEPGADAFSS